MELVLQENANFDIAYDGIANAFIRTEDYDKAMEYYRYSNNTTGYSNAFNKQRTEIIENYLLVVIAVIVVVGFFVLRATKKTKAVGGVKSKKSSAKVKKSTKSSTPKKTKAVKV